MTDTRIDLLRHQFDLTWALFEYHLERLAPGDFLWEPASLCWTVHHRDGVWVPDWADEEPDPVPVPTVALLTWHIEWWWETTLALVRGHTPRAREEIHWSGPEGTHTRLGELRGAWSRALPELDPDTEAPFPWPAGSGMTTADTAAWVNVELTKNAAKVGQLRMLRAAGAL